MARSMEVARNSRGITEFLDGEGSIMGRDSSCGSFCCIHGHCVGSEATIFTLLPHNGESQPIADAGIHTDTDISRGVADHKGEQLGSSRSSRENKVAFVFTVVIVDDNNGTTLSEFFNSSFDALEKAHDFALVLWW